MTTWTERMGDEVYVYVRGRLVMKRWLSRGVSVTFHTWGLPEWRALKGGG